MGLRCRPLLLRTPSTPGFLMPCWACGRWRCLRAAYVYAAVLAVLLLRHLAAFPYPSLLLAVTVAV